MHIFFISHVTDVKGQVIQVPRMKCHKVLYLLWGSLMFGALISYDLFLLHMVSFIFFLLLTMHISKWVEANATKTNNSKVVIDFVKTIFARFGTLRALVSDRGMHFYNKSMEALLQKYIITHKQGGQYQLQYDELTRTRHAFMGQCKKKKKKGYKSFQCQPEIDPPKNESGQCQPHDTKLTPI